MNYKIKLGYGAAVALEALVAFAKSNTAADLMWYICRVFGGAIAIKGGHSLEGIASVHSRMGID